MFTKCHTRRYKRKKKQKRKKFCKSFWKGKKYQKCYDNADKKTNKASIYSGKNMTIVIQNFENKATSKRDKKYMREKYKHDILVTYHPSININRSEKKIGNNRKKSHLSSDNSTLFISLRVGSRGKEIS
jgi:hypothetical protein